MEEKYLPTHEENFFAVQLVLRTKTETGEEPDFNPQTLFVNDLVADFLHPEYMGNKYVLTSSSGEIFFPSTQDKALPLKIVSHNKYGVPSIEVIKPVFYKTCEEGYTSPVELKEEEEYETI